MSPLVALMQDQKEKFAPRGLTVEYVGASDDSSHERITQGLCQLVYMSPESLICNLHWRELLKTELSKKPCRCGSRCIDLLDYVTGIGNEITCACAYTPKVML